MQSCGRTESCFTRGPRTRVGVAHLPTCNYKLHVPHTLSRVAHAVGGRRACYLEPARKTTPGAQHRGAICRTPSLRRVARSFVLWLCHPPPAAGETHPRHRRVRHRAPCGREQPGTLGSAAKRAANSERGGLAGPLGNRDGGASVPSESCTRRKWVRHLGRGWMWRPTQILVDRVRSQV